MNLIVWSPRPGVSVVETPDLRIVYAMAAVVASEGRDTLIVDCSSRVDPYALRAIARRLSIPTVAVTEKVYTTRVFTAYQLLTIFSGLSRWAEEYRNGMIVVVDMARLLKEVRPYERSAIAARVFRVGREMTRKLRIAFVVTEWPAKERRTVRTIRWSDICGQTRLADWGVADGQECPDLQVCA